MSLAGVLLALALSPTAGAENPEVLPVPTAKEPLKFTSQGSSPTFETTKGTKLTCEKYTSSGELTSARSGEATIDFSGCQTEGTKCNSAGDPAGTVLDHGAIHVVDTLVGGVLTVGIQANLSEAANLVFKCGGVITIEVKGAIITVATGVKDLQKFKELKGTAQQSKGEQEPKECDLPKETCEGKKFVIEINTGKGFELMGALETGTVVFEKEIEVHF